MNWFRSGMVLMAGLGLSLGVRAQVNAVSSDYASTDGIGEKPSSRAEAVLTSGMNLPALYSFSDAELEELVQILAARPTLSPEELPKAARRGAFFSLQHPDWPPLPGNVPGLPVWDLGDSYFLMDDLEWSYTGQKSSGNGGGMMLLSEPPPPPGGGGGGDEGGGSQGFAPPVYTTNDLWLEISGWTNKVATLNIHLPWNETNGTFDLFGTTNLSMAVPGLNLTNWLWLFRTAGWQTNLTVSNEWVDMGFFRLGTMLDSDGDGLTDAYENLVSHTNPNSADTDGDGIPDGVEVSLGTNPLSDDSAQSGSRLNYIYDLGGWLLNVTGVRGETVVPDAEGNIQQASQ